MKAGICPIEQPIDGLNVGEVALDGIYGLLVNT